ncbi:aldehyde dehydrogenase [Fredinandcohnia onubensis]|uniref:aldehyde dehydrogenase n=1 Tax=Fredinandcohnia onubensis TaxID=1571209 RepID=UPI001C558C11|nr:aldehyde dehydrogenase [Fredinandcohnia onubensis]
MLINGEWKESSEQTSHPVINPYNKEIWGTIPQASRIDINYVIDAANKAFHTVWKKKSGYERAKLMFKLADLIDENTDRLAFLETKDNGKVLRETKKQVPFAARMLRFYAGYADKIYGETIPVDNLNLFDYTLREPVGVCVLITAWNSPLQLLMNKLAPALAAGNCAIVKPSEHASVTTLLFGQLVEQAGFPPGVINIVTGDGRVGQMLTESGKVQKISFTGGTTAGRFIGKSAANNFIPLTLELGGKSPNIIFEDANLDKAVPGAMAGIFASSGQTCIAGSRLLVQESIYAKVANRLAERAKKIRLGDPLDDSTEMGPVANENQYNSITNMLKDVEEEGAKVIVGNEGSVPTNGYFIKPTILVNVENDMKVAREEIFGPVLCMIPFKDEAEAIAIANNSNYGLASGIWTTDLSRAHRVAKQLEAGTVWVNTYRTSAAQAPFGGMKHSGFGRERGWHSLQDYTRVKNVMIDLSDNIQDPFSINV